MKNLICVVLLALVVCGCQKKEPIVIDNSIIQETVDQCRDKATGQFVPCPK